jgi:hypothetical protein
MVGKLNSGAKVLEDIHTSIAIYMAVQRAKIIHGCLKN